MSETGFFSLDEGLDGKWTWILYSNNFHEITRGQRYWNRKHHAAEACKRFHKIVSGANFTYGKGFAKKPEPCAHMPDRDGYCLECCSYV